MSCRPTGSFTHYFYVTNLLILKAFLHASMICCAGMQGEKKYIASRQHSELYGKQFRNNHEVQPLMANAHPG